jgi:hypothetical protein
MNFEIKNPPPASAIYGTLPDPQYPNNVAVYREGEPAPAGNVYTSFAAAHAALAGIPGVRWLIIDDSLGSPVISGSDTYDLNNIVMMGRTASGSTVPLIAITGAATIAGDFLRLSHVTLANNNAGNSPISASGGFRLVTLDSWATIGSLTGAAPLIDVTGNNTTIIVNENCSIANGGAVAVAIASGQKVTVSAGAGNVTVSDNVFSGPVGSAIDYDLNAPRATLSKSHSSFSGTITLSYRGDGMAGLGVPHTIVTSTPHSVGLDEYHLSIDVGAIGGAAAVNLPSGANLAAGRTYWVKDKVKGAAASNITVTPNGADTVDNGAASYALTINGQLQGFRWDGVSDWELV